VDDNLGRISTATDALVASPKAPAQDDLSDAADAQDAVSAGPPSLSAARSLREYFENWTARLRAGDTGMLPVVGGLIILAIIFQSLNSYFLTAGNLVNLMVQGAVYMLFSMGMIFVLLIGEIDLSIGYIGGVAGVVMAELVFGDSGVPWWVAVGCALASGAAIGLLNGLVITLIGLPSFVVTLAGLLAWNGVMLMILGNGGTVPINNDMVNNLANGLLSPLAGWLVMAVIVAVFVADLIAAELRRRRRGNVAAPVWVAGLKGLGIIAAGIIVVAICNTDRGRLTPIQGVPWVVLIVLGLVTIWSILLSRTSFGTYVYAIGGNAEAARRAGIAVNRIRVWVFVIAGLMGGVAGLIYASRLRSVSTNLDGGTLVLYCIAASVIGGTSLFGGRGKAVHAILGGLVIASIDNGMGLLGLSAAARYVVTGIVLLAAVSLDAFASRGRASSGLS
jgi:D-xylose transport system permease protein